VVVAVKQSIQLAGDSAKGSDTKSFASELKSP
jgi:hypothetical protein